MRYIGVVAFVAVFASGCATGPVEETKAFVSAVAAVKSSTDSLLDDLNIAEKKNYAQRYGNDPVFTVGSAYYVSNIAEAPDTAQYRRALVILHEYAELLRVLVDGSNVESVRGQIEALAATVATFTGTPGIGVAVNSLSALLDRMIVAGSVAEARRLAVEGEPAIQALLAAMKNATPSMFRVLTLDLRRARAENSKFSAYRVALANYVVLIDRLDEAFMRLIRAFERPSNPVTLAALVKTTAELTADVRAARQALAALRRAS